MLKKAHVGLELARALNAAVHTPRLSAFFCEVLIEVAGETMILQAQRDGSLHLLGPAGDVVATGLTSDEALALAESDLDHVY